MSIQNITDKFYAEMAADTGASGMNHTSALNGRIHPTEGRRGRDFPSMSFFIVDGNDIQQFGGIRTADILYQLTFYGDARDGSDPIMAIADKAFALLNENILTTAPTGYDRATCRVMRRGATTIEEDAIMVSMDVRVLATDF